MITSKGSHCGGSPRPNASFQQQWVVLPKTIDGIVGNANTVSDISRWTTTAQRYLLRFVGQQQRFHFVKG